MKVVRQNSAIKGFHEFYIRLHKDLAMLIMPTPIPLLTSVTYSSPM